MVRRIVCALIFCAIQLKRVKNLMLLFVALTVSLTPMNASSKMLSAWRRNESKYLPELLAVSFFII